VKLSCPSCGAKYSIADEKVSDRLAKIRCRKCSATIIVDGKVSPPNVYTSAEAAPPPAAEDTDASGGAGIAAGEYSVDFGDNDQRTLTTDDIVQAFRRGELNADTFVWAEGFADWQPISSVPELADALNAVAGPPRAAARTGSGRGSATDLFGGIETAGSEEDVMTSAPQPAAVPAPALAATGARNESSVLFSLSALTASAPSGLSASKPSPSSIATATAASKEGDDSGLIDLKALTSAAAAAPASPLVLGTAPLGMAAPLGGMTAPAIASDRPAAKQGGGKAGLYIAGALLVVGTLIAGAIVITGGREPTAAAQPTAVPTAAPVAPAPIEEKKPEQATASPPSTGTAVAEAPKDAPPATGATPDKPPTKVAVTTPKTGTSHAKKTTPVAEKPAEKPAAKPDPAPEPAAEKKPPKKKEKTCNCSPGDLMCAMKCAAT
jgi:predicted Zn finger-like uncharacterized protein